jgi:hypothetical protein
MVKSRTLRKKRGRPPDPVSRKIFTQQFASCCAYAMANIESKSPEAMFAECEIFFSVGSPANNSRKGETWRKYFRGERGFSKGLALQKTLKALTSKWNGVLLGDASLIDLLIRGYGADAFTPGDRDKLEAALGQQPMPKRLGDVVNGLSIWRIKRAPVAEDVAFEERLSGVRQAAERAARHAMQCALDWEQFVESDIDPDSPAMKKIASSISLQAWWIASSYLADALSLDTRIFLERNVLPTRVIRV